MFNFISDMPRAEETEVNLSINNEWSSQDKGSQDNDHVEFQRPADPFIPSIRSNKSSMRNFPFKHPIFSTTTQM